MAENETNFRWVAVILAAGSSSRMGRPKQFIKIGDETLIRKTVSAALAAEASEIIVVTGLDHDLLKDELLGLRLHLIVNPESEKGMGSSLKFGVDFVSKTFSEVDAVMIMVCDQPLVNSAHLVKIISEYQASQNLIITSFYSGRRGVPVLFHSSMFEKLLSIKDQQGAKSVIEENPTLVKSIDFPEGAIDLDTPEDLESFTLNMKRLK